MRVAQKTLDALESAGANGVALRELAVLLYGENESWHAQSGTAQAVMRLRRKGHRIKTSLFPDGKRYVLTARPGRKLALDTPSLRT